MAITTEQALQQLEHELTRGRNEVKSLEGRRHELLKEIEQIHSKNQVDLEQERIWMARERDSLLKGLLPLRKEVAELKSERDSAKEELEQLREVNTESIREHERLIHVAKAEVQKIISEKQTKLDAIIAQYHAFKTSLPESL